MTVKDLSDFVIYAGAFAAALSAIGYLLYRIAVRPTLRWLKAEIGATREELGATRQTAEAVHAEMSPNHGSSLRDAVDRAEVKLDSLDGRLAEHIRNHPGGG